VTTDEERVVRGLNRDNRHKLMHIKRLSDSERFVYEKQKLVL